MFSQRYFILLCFVREYKSLDLCNRSCDYCKYMIEHGVSVYGGVCEFGLRYGIEFTGNEALISSVLELREAIIV